MSENYIFYQPTKQNRLDFNKIHNDISNKWEEKARSLQKRRWRKVRESEKKLAIPSF